MEPPYLPLLAPGHIAFSGPLDFIKLRCQQESVRSKIVIHLFKKHVINIYYSLNNQRILECCPFPPEPHMLMEGAVACHSHGASR